MSGNKETGTISKGITKYNDYKCKEKDDVNKFLPKGKGIDFILDGALLQTSKHRISIGVNPADIYVAENDLGTFKIMTETNERENLGININLGDMCDVAKKIKKPIGLIYGDYMGNIKGSNDLDKTLSRCGSQLTKDSTIAVTFCTRLTSGWNSDTFIDNTKRIIIERTPGRKIQSKLTYGYQRSLQVKRSNRYISKKSRRKSASNMGFLMFSVDSKKKIIEKFRPRKNTIKEKVLGSDVIKLEEGNDNFNVNDISPNKYYDKISWYLYPNKPTWEPHGNVIKKY